MFKSSSHTGKKDALYYANKAIEEERAKSKEASTPTATSPKRKQASSQDQVDLAQKLAQAVLKKEQEALNSKANLAKQLAEMALAKEAAVQVQMAKKLAEQALERSRSKTKPPISKEIQSIPAQTPSPRESKTPNPLNAISNHSDLVEPGRLQESFGVDGPAWDPNARTMVADGHGYNGIKPIKSKQILAERYLIRDQIGEGGMAIVYHAFDKKENREVAIKMLMAHLAIHENVRQRFKTEAATMTRLKHKNIVEVFDIVSDLEEAYMVMEYLSGGSLMDRIDAHGVLEPRIAVNAAIDMLQALSHAHKFKVVHRDVKPHNVLISNDGTLKVTDFGIARIEDDLRGKTKSGAFMGTVAYMAPEQRISAKRANSRSDLYAIGASLYVMLTNENPIELFIERSQNDYFSSLPTTLASFLSKACHMTPSERYGSAEEMAAALLTLKIDLPPIGPNAKPLYIPGVAAKGIHVRQTQFVDPDDASGDLDESTQPIEKN